MISSDAGRYLGDLSSRLVNVDLVEEVKKVISSLVPVNLEVRLGDNRIFLMRILPYRTLFDRIDGAVITFTDITERELRENLSITVSREAEILASSNGKP